MRKLYLNPSSIVVPGEYELGDLNTLKLYHRIFDSDIVPPSIVVGVDRVKRHDRFKEELESKLRFIEKGRWLDELKRHKINQIMIQDGRLMEKFEEVARDAHFYLIDGNHRSVAATLTNQKVPALQLERDEDLVRVKEMVERGELFEFNQDGNTVDGLIHDFEEHCLNLSNIDYVTTVEERVRRLVKEGLLPRYITNKYKGN